MKIKKGYNGEKGVLMNLGYGKRNNRLMYLLIGAVVLIALGTAGFFAKNYYDLRANPDKVSEEETTRLTDAVGKLYQLPNDETPIVGKVQDKEKLKDQPFFANAQNDDNILIYQKAKIALIYRAKDNKLINVGPIAINASPQEGQSAANVKVLNGTTKQGAVDDAKKLLGEVAGLAVDAATTDAKNKNQRQTIVVDLKGDKGELVQQIADKLEGKVGELPAGESKPEGDVLVVVGGY